MEWGGGGRGRGGGRGKDPKIKTSSGEELFIIYPLGGRGRKFWLNQIKIYLQVN